MPLLFDASALVDLMLDPTDVIPKVRGNSLLDLTFYEAGNVFWKSWRVRRSATFEEAQANVDLLPGLAEVMRVLRFDEIGLPRIHRAARETGLSFYDSAYIAAAADRRLDLVTSDDRLRRGAKGNVRTLSPAEL